MCIQKGIVLNVRWMPSHLKLSDARPAGVSDCDILSHGHADQQAGLASQEHSVLTELACTYFRNYDLVTTIQKMIIAIIRQLPEGKSEKGQAQ